MTSRKKVVAAFMLLFMLVLMMVIMTTGSCVSTVCAGFCDYPPCPYLCADECGVVSP
jgi:hypothetical protein